MEEKSIRIYDSEKTFFSKITSTISKLLIPTKIGINGMIISIKRNNILKAFEALKEAKEQNKKDIRQVDTMPNVFQMCNYLSTGKRKDASRAF